MMSLTQRISLAMGQIGVLFKLHANAIDELSDSLVREDLDGLSGNGTGGIVYHQRITKSGTWSIKKSVIASDGSVVKTVARSVNNTGVVDATSAWANRASLTYI